MRKQSIPWGTVIFMLLLFFPIGIWLLIRKMTDEKHRYYENGKALRYVGIFLCIFGPVYPFLALTGELTFDDGRSAVPVSFIMLILLVALGVLCIIKSRQFMLRGKLYSQYFLMLATHGTIDIDPIAAELKLPYERTVSDLQGMIAAGYLHNACVDIPHRRLVLKKTTWPTRQITCPCCGGNNTVEIGKTAKCEYCNSPLPE